MESAAPSAAAATTTSATPAADGTTTTAAASTAASPYSVTSYGLAHPTTAAPAANTIADAALASGFAESSSTIAIITEQEHIVVRHWRAAVSAGANYIADSCPVAELFNYFGIWINAQVITSSAAAANSGGSVSAESGLRDSGYTAKLDASFDFKCVCICCTTTHDKRSARLGTATGKECS
jgi:hypothetical protein